MLYEKPWMDIQRFEERDVVITSLTSEGYHEENKGDHSTSTGGSEW